MERKGLLKLTVCGIVSGICYSTNFKRENVTKFFKPKAHIKADTPGIFKNVWNENWDCRQPNKSEVNKNSVSSSTRHIILIRHGQYYSNNRNAEDRCLTPLGRKQAELTGKRLKELDLTYNRIIESTKTRAKETSALIQEHLPNVPVSQTDLLWEGSPIPPLPEPFQSSWKPNEEHFFTEGARIEAAFRKYIHRANSIQKEDSIDVLVCHGIIIRYFVCRALQFPPEGWLRMNLAHGSITWITIRPNGRVTIRCLGETGHMPVNVVTY